MGNSAEAGHSPIIVDRIPNIDPRQMEYHDFKDSQRSRATDTERRLSHLENRKLVCQPKLKIIPNCQATRSDLPVWPKKHQDMHHYSLGKLEAGAEKNSPKQKIKITKQKIESVRAQKGLKLSTHNSHKFIKNSNDKNVKSFDNLNRPQFLSTGGSASKRKLLGIKQSSLNKVHWGSTNEKKQNKAQNLNPYSENAEQNNYISKSKDGHHKFKNAKSQKGKLKMSSVHQFYFSKNQKQKPCGEKCKGIYISVENHKNPLGRSKNIPSQNRSGAKNPAQKGIARKTSPLKLQSPKQAQRGEIPFALIEKQYSICSDSRNNLSKMMIQEVESVLKPESEESKSVMFILEESIIVRGLDKPLQA